MDAFDRWVVKRDDAEDQSISARYLSREIPGYQALDTDGTWREDPTYGNIWIPRVEVSSGWTPYHTGPGHGLRLGDGRGWMMRVGDLHHSITVVGPISMEHGHGGQGLILSAFNLSNLSMHPHWLHSQVPGHLNWRINLSIGGAISPGVAWFPLAPGEQWRLATRLFGEFYLY